MTRVINNFTSILYAMCCALVMVSCIALLSCKKKKTLPPSVKINISQTTLRYARGFNVTYHDGIKEVEVLYPFQGAISGCTYLLVPKGCSAPVHSPTTRVINIPVNSIVCTSTTHIPLLDYLGLSDKLVGFPTTDYISSTKMRQQIDNGKVQELGVEKSINLEKLVLLDPDVVMGYTLSSDYGQFKKIEELGVPVVINAEYLEKHPLGRAEWIKFMALFFNKENVADSVFTIIEKSYLETKALAEKIKDHPSVLSGIVYGDAWYLPGGQNYAARLLKDAGCLYRWENEPSNGYLQLNFESVYEKAHNADLWIGVGMFASLEEIRNADQRYTWFKPFTDRKVYTYNARTGAKGGSEFMELGYMRPDIILKDLVKIAHPQLLPYHSLYFYKKLE